MARTQNQAHILFMPLFYGFCYASCSLQTDFPYFCDIYGSEVDPFSHFNGEWMSLSFQRLEEGTQAWFGADYHSDTVSWRPCCTKCQGCWGPCLSEGDSWGQGVFGARRAYKRYRLQEVYLASFFPSEVALKHRQRIQVSCGIGLKFSGFKISCATSGSEIIWLPRKTLIISI